MKAPADRAARVVTDIAAIALAQFVAFTLVQGGKPFLRRTQQCFVVPAVMTAALVASTAKKM